MLPKLKLTTAERMYLWRKRKGLDQPEAAACHGMTVSAWREMERGSITRGAPSIRLDSPLTQAEICRILRRRQGLTHHELAKEIGVSSLWLLKMENGRANCHRLAAYWNAQNA